jgi:flavin reductase (DIM6/NTAB) family NADH-FMN oxidoreductase RutF
MTSLPIQSLAAEFRMAMRRLAATVTIVTCADENGWHGMTATAVTSVCTEPPTILVCINSDARLYAKASEQKRFCVNLLKSSHAALSNRFGSRLCEQDRFAIGDWIDFDGLPYLEDAQANLFCTIEQIVKVGSHGIFVGRIDRVIVAADIEPLIYQDGKYATTSQIGH